MSPVVAYVVAISTLLCCGLTAVILIRMVSKLDPPAASNLPARQPEEVAV